VIVLAGSGVGNQADLLPTVKELLKRGFTVMTFDYRGFGPNGSGPSDSLRRLVYSSAYVRDMVGALKLARQRVGPHRHLFAYGSDLGSGVSIAAAARTKATDGVVADGLWAMTREYILNAGLSQDYRAVQYANTQVLMDDEPAVACVQLKVPLMLITCERDSIMPPLNAQAAARGATVRLDIWMVQGARHGESIAKSPDYWERLSRWFKMLQAIPRAE
jgi:pimeloyl-ACP methyl ester carboxylesterase